MSSRAGGTGHRCSDGDRVVSLGEAVVLAVTRHLTATSGVGQSQQQTAAAATAAATTPTPLPDANKADSASKEATAEDAQANGSSTDGAPAAAASSTPSPSPAPASSGRLTLAELSDLLRQLTDAKSQLCAACPPDFLVPIALSVKDAVLSFLLSVRTDDEARRAWSRRSIARPLVQVETLLVMCRPYVDPLDVRRWIELFELEFSWAYARCRTLPLDRRINGLNDIKDVIEVTEKKEAWFKKKSAASSGAQGMLSYVNAAVQSSLSMPEPVPAYTRIWMSSGPLCRWLVKNRVLEELLEPTSTHVELIRRCLPVMRLLSQQPAAPASKSGASSSSSSSSASGSSSDSVNSGGDAASSSPLLTTAHLDLLWQFACSGKHESIEHLIYDIAARLAPTLSPTLAQHLFCRICEKPLAEYDEMYLSLIHNFTVGVLRDDSPVALANAAASGSPQTKGAAADNTFGIDLLWTLLQSAQTSTGEGASSGKSPAPLSASPSGPPPAGVLLRARTLLLDLLSLPASANHRTRFLERCVANIKNNVLVTQSLVLLLRLLQLYPLKSASWFGSSSSQTQPAVIEALQERHDLLNIVLREIVVFQTKCSQELAQMRAQEAQQSSGSSPSAAAAQAASLSALQADKLEQLDIRLEFLVSLLSSSSLQLSRSQVDALWVSLVTDATQPAGRDSIFSLLIDAAGEGEGTSGASGNASIMSSDVKAYLFSTRILAMDPASMTPLAFQLLLRYFLQVHSRAGAIKVDERELSSLKETAPSASPAAAATAPSSVLRGEFGRVLAKHRSKVRSAAASSNAPPPSQPSLSSSPSELAFSNTDYSVLSDEEQLSASPAFELSVLSATQRVCGSLSVLQYNELKGISLLWHVILANPRARVARQAIVLVNALHQNLSSKLKSAVVATGAASAPQTPAASPQVQIRDRHLKQCLSHLSAALQEASSAGSTGANGNSSSRPGSEPPSPSTSALVQRGAQEQQAKKKVSRCIVALKTFLNGFAADKNAASALDSDESAPPPSSFVLRCVPAREYRTPDFSVVVPASSTIADLRTAVFTRLSALNPSLSQKSMALVWDQKKLLTPSLVLDSFGMQSGDRVLVKRNSDLFGSYAPNVMVYSSPSATVFGSMFFDALDEPWIEMLGREKYKLPSLMQRVVEDESSATRSWARKQRAPGDEVDPALANIAADSASFDRLFSLLSPSSPISESCFDILMLLPSNSGSVRSFLQVQSLGPDRWPLLLDVKNMYRLLYSLQTLEEILGINAPPTSAAAASTGARPAGSAGSVPMSPRPVSLPDLRNVDLAQWCAAFIQKGGVRYLASVVTNRAWQQLHIGGGAVSASAAAATGAGPRRGSLSAATPVPRALYHEVLRCLFSLLHAFFTLDPLFPDPLRNAAAISPPAQLAEGCWTKLPNWEQWIKQIVTDAILPAVLNSQRALDSSAAAAAVPAGADAVPLSRDENASQMLIAAMRLLLGCVHAVPSLLQSVFIEQPAQTESLLTVLLLQCGSAAARTQTAQVLLTLFKLSFKHAKDGEQQTFWLRMLQQLLRSPFMDAHAEHAHEFFLLYAAYIDVLFLSHGTKAAQPSLRSALQSMALFSALVERLRQHASQESYDDYQRVDEVLYGVLQLLRSCVIHRLVPEQLEADAAANEPASPLALLAHVYHACLFNTPADDVLHGCLCKLPPTRVQAFALLLELSAVYEHCFAELLRTLVSDPMWQVARPASQWSYDPTQFEHSSTPAMPVGLKNQGATCYMNSFLQVLFNNAQFRRAIMDVRAGDELTAVDEKKPLTPALESAPSDAGNASASSGAASSSSPVAVRPSSYASSASVLQQLQLLFGHLAWGQKSFFDTLDFCLHIKDYNGAPLNIGEQKDVNEFAALLFDQIENEMSMLTKVKPGAVVPAPQALPPPAAPATDDAEKPTADGDAAAGSDQPAVAADAASDGAAALVSAPLPPPSPRASLHARNVSSQRLIESTFKGLLVHEILSQNPAECPHATARTEPFAMLSLPVVNKSGVTQSLETFVEGDLLDHENKYWCDRCSKKVAALKRCCLHDERLPSCLILHLKRLEFDFDSMRKVKVNSHFSFPYRAGEYLNVEPYTQSGLARAEAIAQGKPVPPHVERPAGFYDYELVGVLVHGGSAESGHYITVCKGEMGRSSSSGGEGSDSAASTFFEFNDQSVRPFNPSDIPSLCFGGVETVEIYDRATGTTVQKEVPSRRNAYMCIYERRWKPEQEDGQPQEEQQALAVRVQSDQDAAESLPAAKVDGTESAKVDSDEQNMLSAPKSLAPPSSSSRSVSPGLSSVSPSVCRSPRPIASFDRSHAALAAFPPAVVQHVFDSNIAFLHDKYVLDSATNWFLFNVLQLHFQRDGGDAPRALQTEWADKHVVQLAQLGVFFVLKLLVRSADNASAPQWIELLYQLFDRSAAARDWFLGYLLEGSLFDDDASSDAAVPASGVRSPPPPATSGAGLFVTLLLECPVQVVREAFVDLIVLVVTAHRDDPNERDKYFVDWQEPSFAEPTSPSAAANKEAAPAADAAVADSAAAPAATAGSSATEAASVEAPASSSVPAASARVPYRPSSRIARLLQYLLWWIPRVKSHHRQYREFWHLLFHLARLGQPERRWLVGQGAVRLLIEQFYMDTQPLIGFNVSPSYGQEPPIRKHVTQAFWPLQLLSILVRSAESDTLKAAGVPSSTQTSPDLVPLSAHERTLLLNGWALQPAPVQPVTRHFLPWLLLDRANPVATLQLLSHWCWEHVSHSCRFFDLALHLVVQQLTTLGDAGAFGPLMSVYFGVLCLHDSNGAQSARVAHALPELLTLLRKVLVRGKSGDERLLFVSLQYLLQAVFHSKQVAQWMEANQQEHAGWLEKYKREHVDVMLPPKSASSSFAR